MIEDRKIEGVIALPLYSALPQEDQDKAVYNAFEGQRKIIFSTNIAETSITIKTVKYVIDCGRMKEKMFNPISKIETLEIVFITKDSADQRKGRAGRTSSGEYFRLYSENNLQPHRCPEILRKELDGIVLSMKSLGIQDINAFDFIEKPPLNALKVAEELLHDLQFLSNGQITGDGKIANRFPVSPQIAKMILQGTRLDIAGEILDIAAILPVSDKIFSKKEKTETDQLEQFLQESGDHITLQKIFWEWKKKKEKKKWCRQNHINHSSLTKAQELRKMIKGSCKKNGIDVTPSSLSKPTIEERIKKALAAGFFANVCSLNYENNVTMFTNRMIGRIDRASSLKNYEQWMIFHRAFQTKNLVILSTVTKIDPKLILEEARDWCEKVKYDGITNPVKQYTITTGSIVLNKFQREMKILAYDCTKLSYQINNLDILIWEIQESTAVAVIQQIIADIKKKCLEKMDKFKLNEYKWIVKAGVVLHPQNIEMAILTQKKCQIIIQLKRTSTPINNKNFINQIKENQDLKPLDVNGHSQKIFVTFSNEETAQQAQQYYSGASFYKRVHKCFLDKKLTYLYQESYVDAVTKVWHPTVRNYHQIIKLNPRGFRKIELLDGLERDRRTIITNIHEFLSERIYATSGIVMSLPHKFPSIVICNQSQVEVRGLKKDREKVKGMIKKKKDSINEEFTKIKAILQKMHHFFWLQEELENSFSFNEQSIKLIQKALQTTPEKPQMDSPLCCMCKRNKLKTRSLSLCGHSYCEQCFQIWIVLQAEFKKFPISCKYCNDPILWRDFEKIKTFLMKLSSKVCIDDSINF